MTRSTASELRVSPGSPGIASLNRFMPLVLTLVFMAAVACTPSQQDLIEGILQSVDSVNGQMTIVTKDGRTVTITIATDALVETEGASSALETLEPGVSVEVEVDDDGLVAQHIEARQAKVHGPIVQIEGDEITVETERGNRVVVVVTDSTRIELEDDIPGSVADLRIGLEVEIKFDPENMAAFKIDVEEEEADIEGVVVVIGDSDITIETERGRRLTLVVGAGTTIEMEDDIPGVLADLQVGIEIDVKFDPFTRRALKIEVEEADEDGEEDEVKGIIESIEEGVITVETEDGTISSFTVTDDTLIKLDDGVIGILADLQVGSEVKVRFESGTDIAVRVELED